MSQCRREILTVEQAAELLQSSRPMIYELIHSGELKAKRIGGKYWRIAGVGFSVFVTTRKEQSAGKAVGAQTREQPASTFPRRDSLAVESEVHDEAYARSV